MLKEAEPTQNKLKIAIAVHGRFDAFDLARGLIENGHNVTVFTNYPKWAVKPFAIPGGNVRSFWPHGAISRICLFLQDKMKLRYPEKRLHTMFGRWAAGEIAKEKWDVMHSWSGISEEILDTLKKTKAIKILMRGSSHIHTQARILEEEEKRLKISLDRPSAWMIAREGCEYANADYIRVISRFAYNSFLNEGIKPEKLLLIPSGARTEDYRPVHDVVKKRVKRIKSGEPLRVLYVGSLSFRKGMLDMKAIIERLKRDSFQFRLVGPVPKEARKFLKKFRDIAQITPKAPQHELPRWYAWADIFVFPTLEDGYAVVLAQAKASGLPIITTTNCAGPDIVVEGKTGWVLPIRRPKDFVEKLLWCNTHREEFAKMTENVYTRAESKNWPEIAEKFTEICRKILEQKVQVWEK